MSQKDGLLPLNIVAEDESRAAVCLEEISELDKLLPGMPAWCVHDLRRTCASGMARLGVQPHVIEACLNHKSGTIRGAAAVYNRFNYAAEKREALTAWGQHVAALPADSVSIAKAA